jgi:hypothetical protein
MTLLLTIGIISFFFAMALFFFPYQLRKLNEVGNRILFTDERAIVYRKIAGGVLLIIGMVFVYIGYRMK